MSSGTYITEEDKRKMKELYYKERVGYRTIAQIMDLHYHTVRRYVKE